MDKPNQRKGSKSNADVGRKFERCVQNYWENKQGIKLDRGFSVEIGIGNKKKPHKFDLGCDTTIIECKSNKWPGSGNVPVGSMKTWNEAMYYFVMCPQDYKKIFVCLRDYERKRRLTLAEYYIDKYAHMIPPGIEIWEFDEKKNFCEQIYCG